MTRILTHSAGTHDVGPAVVAIGVFDGVHLGHQALVRDAIALATARGVSSCVLTFDRDPDQVVTPGRAAPQLTTLEDKLALLSDVGPDVVLVVPFDADLAALSPEEFCTAVLLDATQPTACVVGYDFRFGARAIGDADALVALGRIYGFDVVAHPLVRMGGAPVTSSRIRTLVSSGDVRGAAILLGRPHRLRGVVVAGRRRGHGLGAPTANLDMDARFALPAPGVYAARATVSAGRYPAAISVGIPPMFPDATCPLEAHLIGFDGDLYGAEVMLEFVDRLRDQRTFDSEDALAEAIRADIERVAAILGTTEVE